MGDLPSALQGGPTSSAILVAHHLPLAFGTHSAYLFLTLYGYIALITVSTDTTHWTVLSVINWGTEYFSERGIESARLNMELLLAHTLHCTRIQLYTNFDQTLLSEDLAALKKLVQRRLRREPLQYIIGSTGFMGLELRVDPRALIPRPETELLVEEVLIEASRRRPQTILEVGTGSGNIAIALAKQVPGVMIDSVDISGEALSLALENIRTHKLDRQIVLHQGDVLSSGWKAPRNLYDCVVSNPPYVSTEEFSRCEPEIRNFEPSIAVTDGVDGLSFFRSIARLGLEYLPSEGKIFVEIAFDQFKAVSEIFTAAGFGRIDHRRDYSGIPRCCIISRE